MNTVGTYIPTDAFLDPKVYDKSANLSIYLDLLNQGVISHFTPNMINAVTDNIFNHINWTVFTSYLSRNNDPDAIAINKSFDGFRNLYCVSELDKQYPNTATLINTIISSPDHHIETEVDMQTGWALFTYIQAYLQDLESGTSIDSYISHIA